MNLFFCNQIQDQFALLSEIESKHAIQVLRMKAGDAIHFIDGTGGYYQGRIIDPHPKRCTVQIEKTVREFGKRDYYVHMAVAPTKSIDRFEWFAEKATEMGIDRITPILCDRSERKIVKTERLVRVVLAAVKQSLKAYIPVIDPITPLRSLTTDIEDPSMQIGMAHCQDELPRNEINTWLKPKSKVLILIGPEGDFTSEEINWAITKNVNGIKLGDSRLRTETAALAAVHTSYLKNC